MSNRKRSVPEPLESGVQLLLGAGDRKTECVRIGDCLRRFIKAHPTGSGHVDQDGHCPHGCSWFELPPSHVRLGLASYWSADHGVERGEQEQSTEDEDDDT